MLSISLFFTARIITSPEGTRVDIGGSSLVGAPQGRQLERDRGNRRSDLNLECSDMEIANLGTTSRAASVSLQANKVKGIMGVAIRPATGTTSSGLEGETLCVGASFVASRVTDDEIAQTWSKKSIKAHTRDCRDHYFLHH